MQHLNGIANVYRMPVATRLRIPVSILRAEPLKARVLAMRGSVSALQGGRALALANGTEIAPDTVIETGGRRTHHFGIAQTDHGPACQPRTRLRITQLRRFLLTNSI